MSGTSWLAGWKSICERMEASFRAGNYADGVVTGVAEISRLLAQHFPRVGEGPNELADKPVIL